jgi:hypothetical protein
MTRFAVLAESESGVSRTLADQICRIRPRIDGRRRGASFLRFGRQHFSSRKTRSSSLDSPGIFGETLPGDNCEVPERAWGPELFQSGCICIDYSYTIPHQEVSPGGYRSSD